MVIVMNRPITWLDGCGKNPVGNNLTHTVRSENNDKGNRRDYDETDAPVGDKFHCHFDQNIFERRHADNYVERRYGN